MLQIMDNKLFMTVVMIWILLSSVGCQPNISEHGEMISDQGVIEPRTTPTIETETTPTIEAVTQPPSPTSVITETPSPSITATTVPTIPTVTKTLATSTSSSEPLPTLSPDEAIEQVMTFLEDTQISGCLLPCWWDAIPGITSWENAKLNLMTISTVVLEKENRIWLNFPLPDTISETSNFTQLYTWNELGIIDTIRIESINISGYDAKTMVGIFGIPDEVWVRTLDAPYLGTLPFELVIVYQSQGFSLYYSVDATLNDDVVTACFEPGFVELSYPDLFPASPEIFIWANAETKTIDEIVQEPDAIFFSLEEKTDLTPETLYEKFANSSESPCIDTSSELWRVGNN